MISTTETYRLLKRLHRLHRPREFGKISQKLLAIAYRLAGFSHLVECGVQGVDVSAANDAGEKYATEVKTTKTDRVVFQRKDRAGLAARQRDGYVPLLGIFRLRPLGGWQFVYAEDLRVGSLLIGSIRVENRHRTLEDRIDPHFKEAVAMHFEGAMKGSQLYLDGILRNLGVEVIDAALDHRC
jgi:hypothetical protein